MSMGVAAALAMVLFLYIELAVGFGYYMFILTSRKMPEANEEQRKQLKKYSIIAGVAFPITFAVIMANKAAERK